MLPVRSFCILFIILPEYLHVYYSTLLPKYVTKASILTLKDAIPALKSHFLPQHVTSIKNLPRTGKIVLLAATMCCKEAEMDIVLEKLFKQYTIVYKNLCGTNPESHMKTFEDILQRMSCEGMIKQSGNGNEDHWKNRVKFTAPRETLMESISTDVFLQPFINRF